MPEKQNYLPAVAIALIAGLLIGLVAAPLIARERPAAENATGAWSVDIAVPAVEDTGEGVATYLTVEAEPGEGRVLTNIDKLLFWTDTQESIQIAKSVAENYTGKNTSQLDLTYTITTDGASIIGGPSAGAALTLSTIAVLEHKQLNSSIMITGTINENGTIGPVGGVLEKGKAAKGAGATLFLVPEGESTETVLRPVERCVQKPHYVYCETRYESALVNISESVGIEVREVATIAEAARYFLAA